MSIEDMIEVSYDDYMQNISVYTLLAVQGKTILVMDSDGTLRLSLGNSKMDAEMKIWALFLRSSFTAYNYRMIAWWADKPTIEDLQEIISPMEDRKEIFEEGCYINACFYLVREIQQGKIKI